MATVLVTGGAGYVGSHMCKALARAGHHPVSYDSLIRGHRELVKWGPLEVGDLHDRVRLIDVLSRYRPTVVMHFASFIDIAESVADPGLYERNIVGGTGTLIEAMAQAGIATLIASSSASVYGVPRDVPIVESALCQPVNPYGAAKLDMERVMARAQETQGLSWVALRYFNAAGADPEAETGEWHEPETHLIPRVLGVAAGDAGELIVNGNDYPTFDGTCIRDYVHVADLAEAHLLAWRHAIGHGGGAVFNLGANRGASVKEVVAAARKITGRDIPVKFGPRRVGDPPVLVADGALAQRVLGWTPRRSDLVSLIEDAWAWQLSRRA